MFSSITLLFFPTRLFLSPWFFNFFSFFSQSCISHRLFSKLNSRRHTNGAKTLQPPYPVLNHFQSSRPIVPRACDHRTQFSIRPSPRHQSCPDLATIVPSSQSCPILTTNRSQTSQPPYLVLNRAQSSPPIMPSPCHHPQISNFEDHERYYSSSTNDVERGFHPL